MRKSFMVLALLLLVVITGCKDKQSSPPLTPKNLPPEANRITFDDETKTLLAVLEKNPKELSALIKLGNIHMDSSRYNEAIVMYQRALEVDPNNQNVRVDMGTCYRNTGRADLAASTYREAISMNPSHAMAHLNLGVVLFDDFRQYDDAVAEFEKFLELAPSSPKAPEIQRLVDDIKAKLGK